MYVISFQELNGIYNSGELWQYNQCKIVKSCYNKLKKRTHKRLVTKKLYL